MNNFEYYNPTKIIFGANKYLEVAKYAKDYGNNVLLHYGSASIKNNGVYDNLIRILTDEGFNIIELDGVLPNPRLSKVREGIELCRKTNVDFILAVGGGSVLDSAKAISGGVVADHDVWEFFQGKVCNEAIPLATILTLPATGTEMNTRCVITNDDTFEKRGSSFPHPVFSILDVELCKTLPLNQKANGIVDMFAHCLERYFTTTTDVAVTDNLLEANMKTIYQLAGRVYCENTDYKAYEQLIWAGTMAHNFILCVGRVTDWASHAIEHDLSGLYDVAHGEGLSVVFPAWMRYVYHKNKQRFAQFSYNVMGIHPSDNIDVDINLGIEAFENFLLSLDMPLTLQALNINVNDIEKLANMTTNYNTKTVGTFMKLDFNDVVSILQIAAE